MSGVKSYDITIDSVPYMFGTKGGIDLGDSLVDPAPPTQLGAAIVENVSNGLGPKLARGNGYYDLHRLIPTVEGQLIFPPKAQVGSAFALSGVTDYTPGLFHHSCPAGQYIALGTRIYRLNLTDFAGLTYTLVASSDCTAAPISNANARYTGGAFVWRDRIYFGIENGLNGGVLGYAYVDFVADDDLATIVADVNKGFSYGAADRGRLFIAQNQAAPNGIQLKWSPDMATNFDDAGFDLFGDSGTFVYGIETRPRVTWVLMMGSAALFFRADGSVLASDEAGFVGVTSPRSQSSGALDNTQGFGAVHYLDGAAYPVFAGGPHHINPVNLTTRSLSPGNLQDIPIEVQDPDIGPMYAVGEHLFMAGDTYLYDVLWSHQVPVVHKLFNMVTLAGAGYIVGAMTQQGGILAITMYNSSTGHFKQIHMEVLPSLRVSTEAYLGSALNGWIEPGILVGPERAASMTKLWLQVRSPYFTRVGAANTVTFTNGLVDESKVVSIASVNAVGPFAAAISGTPQTNRLGRTLSFRLNMNPSEYTGFNERLYLPLSCDFLWAPSVADRVTIRVTLTSEQASRAGSVWVRTGARAAADALAALHNSVATIGFPDTGTSWTVFVEQTEVTQDDSAESGRGQPSYIATLVCRRLS